MVVVAMRHTDLVALRRSAIGRTFLIPASDLRGGIGRLRLWSGRRWCTVCTYGYNIQDVPGQEPFMRTAQIIVSK